MLKLLVLQNGSYFQFDVRFENEVDVLKIISDLIIWFKKKFQFGVNPMKLFFFVQQKLFPFFAIKLSHFILIDTLFSYGINTQA
jgi:hypothetical protein